MKRTGVANHALDHLRPVALMPAAALLVHELRYVLAPDVGEATGVQQHAYLQALTPWIVFTLALVVGAFLARLARARRVGEVEGTRREHTLRLWLVASLSLLLVYAVQEFSEGLLADGAARGLAGVFAGGSLLALPAAVAVGGVVALLVRGAQAVVKLVARPRARRPGRRAIALRAPRPRDIAIRPLDPLAAAAAGRAPPFH